MIEIIFVFLSENVWEADTVELLARNLVDAVYNSLYTQKCMDHITLQLLLFGRLSGFTIGKLLLKILTLD